MAKTSSLYFDRSPVVKFGTNDFQDVPVILQHDTTPIIQIIFEPAVGYTTSISVFDRDGTYLAKAEGPQLYPTAEGISAGVQLLRRDGATFCELAGRTAFELRRTGADTLRIGAELYAPSGQFIRANDEGMYFRSSDGQGMDVTGNDVTGCSFSNLQIAIRFLSDGNVEFGYPKPPASPRDF